VGGAVVLLIIAMQNYLSAGPFSPNRNTVGQFQNTGDRAASLENGIGPDLLAPLVALKKHERRTHKLGMSKPRHQVRNCELPTEVPTGFDSLQNKVSIGLKGNGYDPLPVLAVREPCRSDVGVGVPIRFSLLKSSRTPVRCHTLSIVNLVGGCEPPNSTRPEAQNRAQLQNPEDAKA